jgi:hypothetical protein
MVFMFAPVITISNISLTWWRIVLAATHRSACSPTDSCADDGTVPAAYTLTYSCTSRTTQYTTQHRATVNGKCTGTHKKQ